MVKNWCKKTPAHFRFTAKFPKVITHDKRLKDVEKELELFFSSIEENKRILYITALIRHKLKIKGKPRGVATLLAQSMIETEIAQELKVDQSTISRDSSLQQKY